MAEFADDDGLSPLFACSHVAVAMHGVLHVVVAAAITNHQMNSDVADSALC